MRVGDRKGRRGEEGERKIFIYMKRERERRERGRKDAMERWERDEKIEETTCGELCPESEFLDSISLRETSKTSLLSFFCFILHIILLYRY